jgi:2-dehydro-3-deoxygluconokinase
VREGVINVALLGECMLELSAQPAASTGAFQTMQLGFGGDTLNTAVYLARLAGPGLGVHYATALGEDTLSDRMAAHWAAEGVGLELVRRLPDGLPGLYMIALDERGERSFSYWRDQAAARRYFDADPTPLEARAAQLDALYLSGISLAILPDAGRERLFALMRRLREQGRQVVFDNNFRPRLWHDVRAARHCCDRALELASTALITADDHQLLHGFPSLAEAVESARGLACGEVVIKRGAAATLVRDRAVGAAWTEVATERVERVVDTTAAGDAFAAGYLARRLAGASAVDAARFGNRVAARVIQHPGALIPAEHMADLAPRGQASTA